MCLLLFVLPTESCVCTCTFSVRKYVCGRTNGLFEIWQTESFGYGCGMAKFIIYNDYQNWQSILSRVYSRIYQYYSEVGDFSGNADTIRRRNTIPMIPIGAHAYNNAHRSCTICTHLRTCMYVMRGLHVELVGTRVHYTRAHTHVTNGAMSAIQSAA